MLELFGPLLQVLNLVLEILQLVIIVSIVLSWIDLSPSNPFAATIRGITEPVYGIVRKWTDKIPGPLDWAPLVIILAIMLIQSYVRLAMTKV